MGRLVGAAEAARRLGVQRATLYAYVSRGVLARRVAIDGRSSLFDVDELEALAGRRRAPVALRPSIDVQVTTAITVLDEEGPRYRGHDVAGLSRIVTFEDAAELLWTGELVPGRRWPAPTRDDVARVRGAIEAIAPGGSTYQRVAAGLLALAATSPVDASPSDVGRRALPVLAMALGPPVARRPRAVPMAELVARSLARRPSDALVAALDRCLVLLADHELASSTLAVRVAASTRAEPHAALLAGLAVLSGPLHGGASTYVHDLLESCRTDGVVDVVGARLRDGRHLPGLGHRIYRGEDPRTAPLLELVPSLDPSGARAAVVAELVRVSAALVVARPNVDLGLGAVSFAAGLAPDAMERVFVLARMAGWLAHAAEEAGERPLRFRAMARYDVSSPASRS